jgi:hypothetical protein
VRYLHGDSGVCNGSISGFKRRLWMGAAGRWSGVLRCISR